MFICSLRHYVGARVDVTEHLVESTSLDHTIDGGYSRISQLSDVW
jgi:hypothetical protein